MNLVQAFIEVALVASGVFFLAGGPFGWTARDTPGRCGPWRSEFDARCGEAHPRSCHATIRSTALD